MSLKRLRPVFLFLVSSFLPQMAVQSSCFGSQGAPGTPGKNPDGDVVLVALTSLSDPGTNHRAHLRAELTGDQDLETDLPHQLLEMQMNIVQKTAAFGPVLLLVPDETTESAVYHSCDDFHICDLLNEDRIRVKVVRHQGVWIRDFGPQVDLAGKGARVIHWKYFDNRLEESKRETLKILNAYLQELIENRLKGDSDDLLEEAQGDSGNEAKIGLDERIALVRDYIQTFQDTSLQRSEDESSAFDVANAALTNADFQYASSQFSVDGGNLLKLADGRCLTTRVLASRNKDQQTDLTRELKDVGGCKDVTFLDPLPGPVIEHVDMFVLPAGGNRILLANYDISNSFFSKHWGDLNEAERNLTVGAALAMDHNSDTLKKLGYDLIPVLSPTPVVPKHGDVYYPTVLNALVRTDANHRKQVLMPVYGGYEDELQTAAQETIRSAFGANTDVVGIEATAAAKAQGAVHCLTLTVPLSVSIFSDSADQVRRKYYADLKKQLDGALIQQVASAIPATGMQGLWAMIEEDEELDPSAIDSSPTKIYFTSQDFEIGVLDKAILKAGYAVEKTGDTTWSLKVEFPDQDEGAATVQWLGSDLVEMSLGDTDWILKRIESDSTTPPWTESSDEKSGSSPGTAKARGKHKHATKPVPKKQVSMVTTPGKGSRFGDVLRGMGSHFDALRVEFLNEGAA